MDPLREVMTIKEASELWRKLLGTIKAACMGQHGYPPRFHVLMSAGSQERYG